MTETRIEKPVAENEEFVEAEITESSQEGDKDDLYSMEELEQLENNTMAYMAEKFKNLRFRKNPKYKFKSGSSYSGSSGSGLKGNRSGASSRSYSKSGHKRGMVDRSKFKCYNYNEPGHFTIECRKPKKARGKRESYEELKEKYDPLVKKRQGKAYIAEGKSWDNSDNDDNKEFGNLALMVSFISTVEMSNI